MTAAGHYANGRVPGRPDTAAEHAQRQQAALKHGLRTGYAAGEAGEETLPAVKRTRAAELREQLQTPEGALELLRERAVRAVVVSEWAEAWMQERAAEGKGMQLFTHALMSRYLAAAGHATRTLALYFKLTGTAGDGTTAARILESLNRDQD